MRLKRTVALLVATLMVLFNIPVIGAQANQKSTKEIVIPAEYAEQKIQIEITSESGQIMTTELKAESINAFKGITFLGVELEIIDGQPKLSLKVTDKDFEKIRVLLLQLISDEVQEEFEKLEERYEFEFSAEAQEEIDDKVKAIIESKDNDAKSKEEIKPSEKPEDNIEKEEPQNGKAEEPEDKNEPKYPEVKPEEKEDEKTNPTENKPDKEDKPEESKPAEEDKKEDKPVTPEEKEPTESESLYDMIKEKLQEQRENEIKELIEGFIVNIKEREEAKRVSEELYEKIKDKLNDTDTESLKEKIEKLISEVDGRERAKKNSEEIYKQIKANLKEDQDIYVIKDVIDELNKNIKKREKEKKESEDIYNKIKDNLIDIPDTDKIKEILDNAEEKNKLNKISEELYNNIKSKLSNQYEGVEEIKSLVDELISNINEREKAQKTSEELYNKIKDNINEDDFDNVKNTIAELMNNIKLRELAEKESKDMYDKIKDNLDKVEPSDSLADKIKKLQEEAEERERAQKESEDIYNKFKANLNNEGIESTKKLLEELFSNVEARDKAKKESEDIYNKIKENLHNENDDKVKNTLEELIGNIESRDKAQKEAEFLEKAAEYKMDNDARDEAYNFFKNELNKKIEQKSRAQRYNNGEIMDMNEFRQEFMKLLNAERESKGLKPLELSDHLQRGTETRAKEQAEIGYLRSGENYDKAHTRPNGEKFRTAFNYLDWQNSIGENILAYTVQPDNPELPDTAKEAIEQELGDAKATAEKMFDMWKNSPGHYNNMMYKNYTTFWIDAKSSENVDHFGTKELRYPKQIIIGVQIMDIENAETNPIVYGTDGEIATEPNPNANRKNTINQDKNEDVVDVEDVENELNKDENGPKDKGDIPEEPENEDKSK